MCLRNKVTALDAGKDDGHLGYWRQEKMENIELEVDVRKF